MGRSLLFTLQLEETGRAPAWEGTGTHTCPAVLRQRGVAWEGVGTGQPHLLLWHRDGARNGPRTWPSPCKIKLFGGLESMGSYVRIYELVRNCTMSGLELSISLISKTSETQTGKNFPVSHSKTQADPVLALLKFRKNLAWFAYPASVFSCHKVTGTNEITKLMHLT